MNQDVRKHYKDITFRENRYRLKLLIQFHTLATEYFDKCSLNMLSGDHIEGEEAKKTRSAINLLMNGAYKAIILADIKPFASSTPCLVVRGHCQNIDLIRNIFNLGRNNIPFHAAIDNIERAIDVYKSNRLASLFRTVNPFFWIGLFINHVFFKTKEKQRQPTTGAKGVHISAEKRQGNTAHETVENSPSV